jgi:hypothetical protein
LVQNETASDAMSDRLKIAGRVEYYDDRNGVIVSPAVAVEVAEER